MGNSVPLREAQTAIFICQHELYLFIVLKELQKLTNFGFNATMASLSIYLSICSMPCPLMEAFPKGVAKAEALCSGSLITMASFMQ